MNSDSFERIAMDQIIQMICATVVQILYRHAAWGSLYPLQYLMDDTTTR